MSIFRLLGPTNLWALPGSALTGSSEAVGLPVAASRNPDRSYVWRSLSQQANQTLTLDLGASYAATAVAISNVALMNSGTVVLKEGGTGTSPGTFNQVAVLPTQNADRRLAFALFGSTSARHWRLEWTNANPAAASTAEVGYVFLGLDTSLSTGPIAPIDLNEVDPSIGKSSVDGQQTFIQRTTYQAGSFSYILITEADLEILRTFRRAYGSRIPFVCILNTDTTWQAWLLRLESEIRVLTRQKIGFYDVSFSWTESR